jgi:hypothetical protein
MESPALPDLSQFPLEAVDAFLEKNDTVALSVDERLAEFASVKLREITGVRAFVLQGKSSARDFLQTVSATLTVKSVDVVSAARAVVSASASVPLSFSSAHALRLGGSEIRLGRLLSFAERSILIGTWLAVGIVAVLLFVPRFPGRRTLAVLLLFLIAASIGVSFVFTGNFAVSLSGVTASLTGGAAVQADLELEGSADAAGVLQPERVRIRNLKLADVAGMGELGIDIGGLSIPSFVLALLRDMGLSAMREMLARVDVTVQLGS